MRVNTVYTYTHDAQHKRFARDPEDETEPAKRTSTSEQVKATRERKPPSIYLTDLKLKIIYNLLKLLKKT